MLYILIYSMSAALGSTFTDRVLLHNKEENIILHYVKWLMIYVISGFLISAILKNS